MTDLNDAEGYTVLLTDARGINLPHDFVRCFNPDTWGIKPEDAAILAEGPEGTFYWDTWHDVLQSARYRDKDGNLWFLHQDGDLFAFCYEKMSRSSKVWMFGHDG